MGFDLTWIFMIMKYVSSVSYSIIVNGNAEKVFSPTRGLKQGDPLSLFLFLICSEVLLDHMRLAIRDGLIRGAKASRSGQQISHLLFVDDCILFGEASSKGGYTLKTILSECESCSDQCVNFDKIDSVF